MTKTRKKRLTRMLAVILTLTMLMSAMMVQAFAASDSEILQGYTASAYCSRYNSNNTPFGEVTYDVAAALEMDISVYYRVGSGSDAPVITRTANGSAYHYQLTVVGETPQTNWYMRNIIGHAVVGYNGSSCTLYPTASYS